MQNWIFKTVDGIAIHVREVGEGRPVILLHGYFSEAETNWIKYGHAALLAEAGFRVIMPDLRAHGLSDKPHDPAHYPKDILADDQLALIDHLGLSDFDLGGYSLGGRTVARMLAKGCRPRRVVISGMGLEGLADTGKRAGHFRHVLENLGKHERGSPAFMAEAFLKTTGGDPVALLRILDTFVDTPVDLLARFDLPIGVVCGEDDNDNGSATALARTLPQGRLISVPGNHMSAVIKPELGEVIRDYLLEAL
ncbi:MAG TPA: alpha/beta fold hydrolase [Sphingorhabdus sp.]|jgi:pimeloyl-ACP methyl ester carboxylesterase|uniref:alpha/beta fold hydrolase n=1 Tax=Sphingorhabdus sp. TaxID=1902408 RepID=UPI002B7273DA|nr:alpha/beta fold hydrolase [Sphingorhabdus sp.]HMT41245.1 alpha/beta fold hydrolase [Sphingorhabdus sp.]HMU21325.1 alpha/beta fold hydrolase [Sphingorhabdus sp.]